MKFSNSITLLIARAMLPLLLAGVSAHAQILAEPKRVTVLMAEQKGDYGQDLPLLPYAQQVLSYMELALQVKLDLRRYPWRRVLYNGENGEGLIFGIYKTAEREQFFAFSEPVYAEKIWLIKRCADPFVFNQMQDLKGKTIGIVQGSSAGLEFDSQVNLLFKAEYNTSSLSGRFSKLYQKRMDAFLYYEPRTNLKSLQRELNQVYASELEEYKKQKHEVFCILPKPVSTVDVHFALSLKSDRRILDKIDQVLIQARKTGELERFLIN